MTKAKTNIFQQVEAAPEAEAPSQRRRKGVSKGREETRLIAGHFSPDYATKLRVIAAQEDRTIQSVLGEALDDLFLKKHMS